MNYDPIPFKYLIIYSKRCIFVNLKVKKTKILIKYNYLKIFYCLVVI
jgi:hypothetical protein